MSATTIEWSDHSVNPIRARNLETGAVGHYCEKPSPGCTNCYASKWNERVRPSGKHLIGTGLAFDVRNRSKVELFLDTTKLEEVLRRRKPTKFFWCDMTDLFGEWVPDEWIDRCFAVMALTPQHTHQVLTKRADRMRSYLTNDGLALRMTAHLLDSARGRASAEAAAISIGHQLQFGGGLRNVWLGVSVENQKYADERIPLLLQTPAAVRFISAEPLLGPVTLAKFSRANGIDETISRDYLRGETRLDWVIVGGESGPGARPFDLAWPRSLVKQCKAAGVRCFVKQLGTVPMMSEDVWRAGSIVPILNASNHRRVPDGFVPLQVYDKKGGETMYWPPDLRVREYPEVRA